MACTATITGTNTASCGAGTQPACDALPCCAWGQPGPSCHNKPCAGIADQSPDVCPGCNTCPGNWLITNARTPTWITYVTGAGAYIRISSGGSIKYASGIYTRFT
jgi:hypothetical protein